MLRAPTLLGGQDVRPGLTKLRCPRCGRFLLRLQPGKDVELRIGEQLA